MSHASLIEWRRAAITALAAATSSRIEIGPAWPARSSEAPSVRSSCARSAGAESGTLSKIALITVARTAAPSKISPNPPTISIASGTNDRIAKKAIWAALRWPRSSTNSLLARHAVSAVRSSVLRIRRPRTGGH